MEQIKVKNQKRLQIELLPLLKKGICHNYWNIRNSIELDNDHQFNVLANLEDMQKELGDAIRLVKAIENSVGNFDNS